MKTPVLAAALLLSVACTSGREADVLDARSDALDATVEVIDPATLDPSTVVFAAVSGGGFLAPGEEEFYLGQRHGSWGLWIYGDRRAVLLDESTVATLGYRVYREGTVSVEAFRALLEAAPALGLAGSHGYSACNATDGGSQVVAVDLPGTAFNASSYMGFEADGCEGDAGSMGDEGKPPADLVAFAKALFDVTVADAAALEPTNLVLAGHVVDDAGHRPAAPCTFELAVPWAVDGVTLPKGDFMVLWTLPLAGQPAADARTFVRAHLVDSDYGRYRSACVPQGDVLYRVYYDDVPDGEAEWPF